MSRARPARDLASTIRSTNECRRQFSNEVAQGSLYHHEFPSSEPSHSNYTPKALSPMDFDHLPFFSYQSQSASMYVRYAIAISITIDGRSTPFGIRRRGRCRPFEGVPRFPSSLSPGGIGVFGINQMGSICVYPRIEIMSIDPGSQEIFVAPDDQFIHTSTVRRGRFETCRYGGDVSSLKGCVDFGKLGIEVGWEETTSLDVEWRQCLWGENQDDGWGRRWEEEGGG